MAPRTVAFTKRAADVVVATLGLGLTLPLYPLVAAAIAVDSRGPIFFRQERANGLLGGADPAARLSFGTFTLLKFRTMCVDAEAKCGPVLAEQDDPRVTRVGRFLRRTRLDELPQLWNILTGDMSLVGPRPERPELLRDLALAIPFFEVRLRGIKPGLTGLAQVNLGYTGAILEDHGLFCLRSTLQNPFQLGPAAGALADDMRAKLLYDLAYAAALEDLGSFLRTELEVLFRTPVVMLCSVGH